MAKTLQKGRASRRSIILYWILPLVLLISILLALSLGTVSIPFERLIQTLLNGLGLADYSMDEMVQRSTQILFQIRMPRVFAALFAGLALALAGASMQGLFRNPMASSEVLGISAGSSLGAVIAIVSGLSIINPVILPQFAMVGGLGSAFLVYAIAKRKSSTNLLFVILAGLAVSSLVNGLVSAVLLFSQQYEVSQFVFWTMGGLGGRSWDHLLWPVPIIVLASAILIFLSNTLDVYTLGEEQAHSLGIPVEAFKITVLSLAAILTAMAISMAGPVGFIGLLVPHMVRLILGPSQKHLLLCSAFAGAIFLILADLVGRIVLIPYEIRVGIITSLIGAPYFIFLISRQYSQGGKR
jgi:iron complex transport system permease protein